MITTMCVKGVEVPTAGDTVDTGNRITATIMTKEIALSTFVTLTIETRVLILSGAGKYFARHRRREL